MEVNDNNNAIMLLTHQKGVLDVDSIIYDIIINTRCSMVMITTGTQVRD